MFFAYFSMLAELFYFCLLIQTNNKEKENRKRTQFVSRSKQDVKNKSFLILIPIMATQGCLIQKSGILKWKISAFCGGHTRLDIFPSPSSLCLNQGRIPSAIMHSLPWLLPHSPISDLLFFFWANGSEKWKGLRKEILNPRKNIAKNGATI